PQFGVGRALFAQQRTHGGAHGGDHGLELIARRRCLEVLDHLGLQAGMVEEGEHVARGATGGVVVDLEHGSQAQSKRVEGLSSMTLRQRLPTKQNSAHHQNSDRSAFPLKSAYFVKRVLIDSTKVIFSPALEAF